jgi:hypothetical protein
MSDEIKKWLSVCMMKSQECLIKSQKMADEISKMIESLYSADEISKMIESL